MRESVSLLYFGFSFTVVYYCIYFFKEHNKNAVPILLLLISTLQQNWRKAQNSFCLEGRRERVQAGDVREK
jgi:hypothetical protein